MIAVHEIVGVREREPPISPRYCVWLPRLLLRFSSTRIGMVNRGVTVRAPASKVAHMPGMSRYPCTGSEEIVGLGERQIYLLYRNRA